MTESPPPPADAAAAPPARLDWIDAARGIGIALVVFGHALRGLVSAGLLAPSPRVSAVDRWIYDFHMPLFFLLAGLFMPRLPVRPLPGYLAGRLRRLGYPYLVWVPIQTLLQIAFSHHVNHPATLGQLARALVDPPFQFWFLYALLLQSIVFGLWRRLGLGIPGFLAASVAAWIAAFWLPREPWPPARSAFEMLPYLGLGVMLGAGDALRRAERIPRWALLLLALAGYGAVAVLVRVDADEVRWLRPLGALAGTTATLALSVLLSRGPAGRVLGDWGKRSLAIYVAHTIVSGALRIALQKAGQVTSPAVHLTVGTLGGIYGPILLDRIAARFRIPLFELPSRKSPSGAPPG